MSHQSEPIVSFTPAAAAHIRALIAEQVQCKGFRLSMKKWGCTGFSYVPELVKEVIETDWYWEDKIAGFFVFIDSAIVEQLKGTQIDFEKKTMGQSQLIYHNPNVEQACGCGSSVKFNDSQS